jgi:DNA-binding transcriptional LysR family regulator
MFDALFLKDGFTFPRIRAFVEVAAAGGIAKAVGPDPARQSQYSRQIGELEDFFGVEVFQKRGKAMMLTDAGKQLLWISREAFHGFEDFARVCSKNKVRMTIGGGDALLQWLVAPQLGIVSRKFPAVALCLQNLRSADVVSGLRDLSLDVGFVRESALPSDLGRKNIGDLKFGIYVARSLLPNRTGTTFSWVAQNLPLACQYSDGEFQHQLQAAAVKVKTSIRIAVECETFPQAAQLLLTGSYAAVLPCIASRFLDAQRFVEVPATWLKVLRRPIVLAWNKRTMRVRPTTNEVCSALSIACTL